MASHRPEGYATDSLGARYQKPSQSLQSWCKVVSATLCTALWCMQGENLLCTSLSFLRPCLLSSQLLVHCELFAGWWSWPGSCWVQIVRGIPRQLLQFLRAPFLGIFAMTPSVQSLGNFFPSQMSVKSGWSRSAASCGCALNTSALRLSCPGDFPFLRDLMAAMIPSFPGGSVLTSRSISASCISTSLGGGGLFRTSLKCSVHRVPC